MNASHAVLGLYVPGRTVWHRMGVGPKYLVFLALTVVALVVDGLGPVLAVLAVALLLVASTRVPLRLAWGLPVGLLVLFAVLVGYHAIAGTLETGLMVVVTILVALYGSRLVLLTTPLPVLVDALVALVRPLRRIGVDPEGFGLAVAVLIRSIPHVAASFSEVRDAARARGLTRNPFAAVTPVVIQAVAFARSTGDALVARGLGDSEEPYTGRRDLEPR